MKGSPCGRGAGKRPPPLHVGAANEASPPVAILLKIPPLLSHLGAGNDGCPLWAGVLLETPPPMHAGATNEASPLVAILSHTPYHHTCVRAMMSALCRRAFDGLPC